MVLEVPNTLLKKNRQEGRKEGQKNERQMESYWLGKEKGEIQHDATLERKKDGKAVDWDIKQATIQHETTLERKEERPMLLESK